ncbi:MAG: hypothetical protein QXH02_03220 [Desulfurococcaceae archaeon]
MFRKRDPLRKSFEVLYSVRLIKDRISKLQSRIDERAGDLTKRLTDLESRGEGYLAKRYAEEVAKLRDLSRKLAILLLIVDKVDLALQHAIVLREFNLIATELRDLVRDLVNLPETKLPDLSILFLELEESVRELSEISIAGHGAGLSYSPPGSSEVKAIIEEAREALRKRLEPVT